jgi:hypothetical protein
MNSPVENRNGSRMDEIKSRRIPSLTWHDLSLVVVEEEPQYMSKRRRRSKRPPQPNHKKTSPQKRSKT